jgi:ribosome recycling factor
MQLSRAVIFMSLIPRGSRSRSLSSFSLLYSSLTSSKGAVSNQDNAEELHRFSCSNFNLMHGHRHRHRLFSAFHSSVAVYGPKKKGGKEIEAIEEDVVEIELPKAADYEVLLDKRISYLESEFSGLRAGRASTDMFNHLDVAAYGSKMSIAEAGQITLKSPTKVSIVAFDPELAGSIATAIREGGMNLNPMVEGNTIMVNIPKPSKESRDLLIKTASKYSEKTKQEIRQIRKDAMDEIKKLKGSISEDDSRRITKEVDVLAEKKVDKVQKIFKDKETELSSA